MNKKRENKFKIEIRRSADNQFYAVIIANNGEPIFISELIKRKYQVMKLVKDHFPKYEITDATKKPLKK